MIKILLVFVTITRYDGFHGQVVKASGWPSFDRQFRVVPYPAPYRRRPCGVAWLLIQTLMVEYINKWEFFF
jgi:hypothetical protein